MKNACAVCATLLIICSCPAGVLAQTAKTSTRTPASDLRMFNRARAGTRYSPLTRITRKNLPALAQAWSYRLQPAGFRFATAGGGSELVPIVVHGVMYISTQTRVVALQPADGAEIWSYDVPGGQASPRGVAWWP